MLYRHATALFCLLSLWQCMMICHQLVCSSLHSARLFPSLSPGHLDSGRFEMRLSKISFSWPVPFLFFLSLLSFPPFQIPLHQLESNGNDSITYRWRGSVVWNDRWKFYDISGTGCHMMPSLGESAPFSELQSFWLVFCFFFLALMLCKQTSINVDHLHLSHQVVKSCNASLSKRHNRAIQFRRLCCLCGSFVCCISIKWCYHFFVTLIGTLHHHM